MVFLLPVLVLWLFGVSVAALRYDQNFVGYNLNENKEAVNPLEYSGIWKNHTFQPSPKNWRFPFYTIFLDKFVNGDPANDDINGTVFEHDAMQTQLRHGGDLQGLVDSLDYIQGMGVKGIYLAGSPFINAPWNADSYSPLDFTLLDKHFGTISIWRTAVTEIHRRGMYVVLDNTMSTMGDLIGSKGFLNSSSPFTLKEHQVEWRDPQRRYLDFEFGNNYNKTCKYPRFWFDTGYPVGSDVTDQMIGCYDSEFDQYGDTEAFGVFPDWQRQLAKFASVQDRLREWVPSVREKIEHFSCLTILMLDIDGFRLDKATQITVDALGDFSHSLRECASRVGKQNFFMLGEIAGGNTFGSVYLGRGRQPDMKAQTLLEAVTTKNTNRSSVIRDSGRNALDASAFHYSTYRALTRFLGLDGNLAAGYDTPINFVDAWNEMMLTNDLVNPNTGTFDPRHMFGVTNQDVFRWPAITQGTERMLLGLFITTLHMPGIPLLLWGEEQAFYALDNTAPNYIFGRQAMSSSPAWEMHSCYKVGSEQFHEFPLDSALRGCDDPWNALDHRDPTSPVRNIIKGMYQMRQNYPALNDGWFLQQLSNQTHNIYLPGSNHTPTEIGIWSTMRAPFAPIQDLSKDGNKAGNQSIWLLYQNQNTSVQYKFDCSDNATALLSPFDEGTTVKNLFYPHDELILEKGPKKLGIDGSEKFNGCVNQIDMKPFEFRAYVPQDAFIKASPVVTKFVPGHDARLQSAVPSGKQEDVPIQFHFSVPMDCEEISSTLEIRSETEDGEKARIDKRSVVCETVSFQEPPLFIGGIATQWTYKANLTNVSNGVHEVILRDLHSKDQSGSTASSDHFIFRIGQYDNPMVFPQNASYAEGIIHRGSDGGLTLSQRAAGSDQFRYSLNWGSSYSNWLPYHGGNVSLAPQPWSGTKRQDWTGLHVILQYHSRIAGTSDAIQHADLDPNITQRRFPHLFLNGLFNMFGLDGGIFNMMELQNKEGVARWTYSLLAEWPTSVQINVWGINPDGQPDKTGVLGDIDGDNVLDRLSPVALTPAMINITEVPPSPHLAWQISMDDANYRYDIIPVGSRTTQIIIYFIMWCVPLTTAVLVVWFYALSFYKVKFNKMGVPAARGLLPFRLRQKLARTKDYEVIPGSGDFAERGRTLQKKSGRAVPSTVPVVEGTRRTILIATMEYDIEDWQIKIKIGGLGVMSQLMGKNLEHQNLIWVVPCAGGIEYPQNPNRIDPMEVMILGQPYQVKVQYHTLKNITYVLLDAPVFRAQSKANPYPPRMDDLDSAIYYSAWNQCIALTIKRFPQIDLYHINDYHGAIAPLYLLPRTIPVCLSLHNAEFQGLWPMRTLREREEVCNVYNLEPQIVQKYVQFGEVFNLLHGAASYVRVHQKGFGAVGVSKKYGKRSWARYPIFWGLSNIGNLPNPDPSDTAVWSNEQGNPSSKVIIDEKFEQDRAELKRKAQEWAGLAQTPNAELLVFVGRWSMQKGIDLIADIMPGVLRDNENVQLICVGPVIDLYGKFAALKLQKIAQKFPSRVYSKPEFTALPPFIFSGADFALIPSRDEPFGLVAVEFGRKGALGIGALVGGLGQMPGWWFTVESTTTDHMLHQFKNSVKAALASDQDTRRKLRARSAKQRFPVAQWVQDLETLQSTAIMIHQKEGSRTHWSRSASPRGRHHSRRASDEWVTATSRDSGDRGRRSASTARPQDHSIFSRAESPVKTTSASPENSLSLGIRLGPGHSDALYELEGNNNPHTDEYILETEQAEAAKRSQAEAFHSELLSVALNGATTSNPSFLTPRSLLNSPSPSPESSLPNTPRADDSLLPPPIFRIQNESNLSVDSVVGSKRDFNLQNVDPTFTDSDEHYLQDFELRLSGLDTKNSEKSLSVEKYLVESEKEWFKRFRAVKLRRSSATSPAPSLHHWRPSHSRERSLAPSVDSGEESFRSLLGDNYQRPTLLRRVVLYRIGDWPIYSFLLALGQIIAATSYQVTLLSGTIKQDDDRFYTIAAIYLSTSIMWWLLFRSLKSVFVLSLPFLIYGIAFLMLGVAPLIHAHGGKLWILNVASGLYAAASSSGSLFFALNFGDEGGSPIKTWVYRCCVIQGTAQIYTCALWFWGEYLTKLTSRQATFTPTTTMTFILVPVASLLFGIGILLFLSLPEYYRQDPGKIPSFYASLYRRKIVLWFFVATVLQNAFLSTNYGRNWQYLWSSTHASTYQIVLLAILFLLILWTLFLILFSRLSRAHSWILPLFAIGLGAPRWAQMLWSCSGIGLYIPWASSPLASTMLSRSLWLWLGLLDALQGVGFGMILLQTLTRIHISATLLAAQVIGTATTMLARAVERSTLATVDVTFPDFGLGWSEGLQRPWFWVGMTLQLIVCAGFGLFFRKEQLSKP